MEPEQNRTVDASKSTELDGTNCLSVVIRASARRTPLADTNRVTPVPARVSLLILSFAPQFLAVGFIQIVLGAWLVTVGFTAVQAGALISAQGIATILTSIPLGIISDIYGRKKLLILGNLAGGAALLVFALTTNFSYLICSSLVLGVAAR